MGESFLKVNVLGQDYTVVFKELEQEPRLQETDGFCDWTVKRIVLNKQIEGTLSDMKEYRNKVLRHEIVHAFLLESGLHECSGECVAWAANEVMVDWFARQGEKIYKAWRSVGCIHEENAVVCDEEKQWQQD